MDRWVDSDFQKVLGYFYFVVYWLVMFNFFVNLIIYGFMNDNFRVSYVIIQVWQSFFFMSRFVYLKLYCCVQVCYCVGGYYFYDFSVNILLIFC